MKFFIYIRNILFKLISYFNLNNWYLYTGKNILNNFETQSFCKKCNRNEMEHFIEVENNKKSVRCPNTKKFWIDKL